MHRNDPGVIVPDDEIARIRSIRILIEADKHEEDARCAKARSGILQTVEKRRL